VDRVTELYTSEAEGVKNATPAVADAFVAVGAVALVTAIPPDVYPEPDTSLVAENAVVEALIVAEARYNAALNVSAVVAARIGATPKLWVPVRTSDRNEVQRLCVFAMIFSFNLLMLLQQAA
jgi:hypothetical protein